jgi:hypothetical protein
MNSLTSIPSSKLSGSSNPRTCLPPYLDHLQYPGYAGNWGSSTSSGAFVGAGGAGGGEGCASGGEPLLLLFSFPGTVLFVMGSVLLSGGSRCPERSVAFSGVAGDLTFPGTVELM